MWTKGAIKREGIYLLGKYPKYKYLEEDPWIDYGKTNNWEKDYDVFYKSVVYAYMADCILEKYPELKPQYEKEVEASISHTKGFKRYKDRADKAYSCINNWFLSWYQDYLREQADPGVLERERKEREERNRQLQLDHDARERWKKWQEEEEIAAGTRVICPYCKSADTKKISVAIRAVSVSLVGAASGKIGKQWHCNHCGSDF